MPLRTLALLLAITAAAGCKKTKEDTCDELAKLGTAFADELGKQLGDKSGKSVGADPEIKQKMAEFKAQCLAWPDAVFECMRKGDEESPKCKAAMEHVTGRIANDLDKAPDGPPIVGRARLGEPPWDGWRLDLAADGTLTAAPKGAVVSFAHDGTERWRFAVDHAGWMLALPELFLVGDRADDAIIALDRTTGAVKWRAVAPPAEDGDRRLETAVRVGERTYVADANGRFLRVDPAACAKPAQKNCLEVAFTLPDETFDGPDLRAIGEDILIGESSGIRRITTTGKVVANIHVRDSFVGVATTEGERIAAVMDDELVLFDLGRCPARPVALARKQGRMYVRGEGECASCTAPPAGCLVARSELSDVSYTAPHVLRDGSIVVADIDGPARVAPNGTKQWATGIDVVGPLREAGDNVVFVSRGDDAQLARVVALSTKTGKVTWTRSLEVTSDQLDAMDDAILETRGPWVVVGGLGTVSWIKIH